METTEYEVRVLDINVKEMIAKLELPEEKVTTLDVQGVYREIYGIDISDIKELKFE